VINAKKRQIQILDSIGAAFDCTHLKQAVSNLICTALLHRFVLIPLVPATINNYLGLPQPVDLFDNSNREMLLLLTII
jgi:hypothetical protein